MAAALRVLPCLSLPGRIELFSREPLVVVDSAHTRESAAGLANWLAAQGRPVRLVLSVAIDKDLGAIVEQLVPCASEIVATRAEPIRSLAPGLIAEAITAVAPELPVGIVEDPAKAVRTARESLAAGEALCIAGSVYLAGIARDVLGAR